MEIDIMYELTRLENYMIAAVGLATLATVYLSVDLHRNPPKYENYLGEEDSENSGLIE